MGCLVKYWASPIYLQKLDDNLLRIPKVGSLHWRRSFIIIKVFTKIRVPQRLGRLSHWCSCFVFLEVNVHWDQGPAKVLPLYENKILEASRTLFCQVSACKIAGAVLNAKLELGHFILAITIWWRYFYPPFY